MSEEVLRLEKEYLDLLKKAGVWQIYIEQIQDHKKRFIEAAEECKDDVFMIHGFFRDCIEKALSEVKEGLIEGKITWTEADRLGMLSVIYPLAVERDALKRLESNCSCKIKWAKRL
jgi:hypothetical protein